MAVAAAAASVAVVEVGGAAYILRHELAAAPAAAVDGSQQHSADPSPASPPSPAAFPRRSVGLALVHPASGELLHDAAQHTFSSEAQALEHIRTRHPGVSQSHLSRGAALLGCKVHMGSVYILLASSVRWLPHARPGHQIAVVEHCRWLVYDLQMPLGGLGCRRPEDAHWLETLTLPLDKIHFFCDTLDLTSAAGLSGQLPSSRSWRKHARRSRFCWNEALSRPFVQAGLDHWCVVLQQGTVQHCAGAFPSPSGGTAPLSTLLISRRSRIDCVPKEDPTGEDIIPPLANEVETEMILWTAASSADAPPTAPGPPLSASAGSSRRHSPVSLPAGKSLTPPSPPPTANPLTTPSSPLDSHPHERTPSCTLTCTSTAAASHGLGSGHPRQPIADTPPRWMSFAWRRCTLPCPSSLRTVLHSAAASPSQPLGTFSTSACGPSSSSTASSSDAAAAAAAAAAAVSATQHAPGADAPLLGQLLVQRLLPATNAAAARPPMTATAAASSPASPAADLRVPLPHALPPFTPFPLLPAILAGASPSAPSTPLSTQCFLLDLSSQPPPPAATAPTSRAASPEPPAQVRARRQRATSAATSAAGSQSASEPNDPVGLLAAAKAAPAHELDSSGLIVAGLSAAVAEQTIDAPVDETDGPAPPPGQQPLASAGLSLASLAALTQPTSFTDMSKEALERAFFSDLNNSSASLPEPGHVPPFFRRDPSAISLVRCYAAAEPPAVALPSTLGNGAAIPARQPSLLSFNLPSQATYSPPAKSTLSSRRHTAPQPTAAAQATPATLPASGAPASAWNLFWRRFSTASTDSDPAQPPPRPTQPSAPHTAATSPRTSLLLAADDARQRSLSLSALELANQLGQASSAPPAGPLTLLSLVSDEMLSVDPLPAAMGTARIPMGSSAATATDADNAFPGYAAEFAPGDGFPAQPPPPAVSFAQVLAEAASCDARLQAASFDWASMTERLGVDDAVMGLWAAVNRPLQAGGFSCGHLPSPEESIWSSSSLFSSSSLPPMPPASTPETTARLPTEQQQRGLLTLVCEDGAAQCGPVGFFVALAAMVEACRRLGRGLRSSALLGRLSEPSTASGEQPQPWRALGHRLRDVEHALHPLLRHVLADFVRTDMMRSQQLLLGRRQRQPPSIARIQAYIGRYSVSSKLASLALARGSSTLQQHQQLEYVAEHLGDLDEDEDDDENQFEARQLPHSASRVSASATTSGASSKVPSPTAVSPPLTAPATAPASMHSSQRSSVSGTSMEEQSRAAQLQLDRQAASQPVQPILELLAASEQRRRAWGLFLAQDEDGAEPVATGTTTRLAVEMEGGATVGGAHEGREDGRGGRCAPSTQASPAHCSTRAAASDLCLSWRPGRVCVVEAHPLFDVNGHRLGAERLLADEGILKDVVFAQTYTRTFEAVFMLDSFAHISGLSLCLPHFAAAGPLATLTRHALAADTLDVWMGCSLDDMDLVLDHVRLPQAEPGRDANSNGDDDAVISADAGSGGDGCLAFFPLPCRLQRMVASGSQFTFVGAYNSPSGGETPPRDDGDPGQPKPMCPPLRGFAMCRFVRVIFSLQQHPPRPRSRRASQPPPEEGRRLSDSQRVGEPRAQAKAGLAASAPTASASSEEPAPWRMAMGKICLYGAELSEPPSMQVAANTDAAEPLPATSTELEAALGWLAGDVQGDVAIQAPDHVAKANEGSPPPERRAAAGQLAEASVLEYPPTWLPRAGAAYTERVKQLPGFSVRKNHGPHSPHRRHYPQQQRLTVTLPDALELEVTRLRLGLSARQRDLRLTALGLSPRSLNPNLFVQPAVETPSDALVEPPSPTSAPASAASPPPLRTRAGSNPTERRPASPASTTNSPSPASPSFLRSPSKSLSRFKPLCNGRRADGRRCITQIEPEAAARCNNCERLRCQDCMAPELAPMLHRCQLEPLPVCLSCFAELGRAETARTELVALQRRSGGCAPGDASLGLYQQKLAALWRAVKEESNAEHGAGCECEAHDERWARGAMPATKAAADAAPLLPKIALFPQADFAEPPASLLSGDAAGPFAAPQTLLLGSSPMGSAGSWHSAPHVNYTHMRLVLGRRCRVMQVQVVADALGLGGEGLQLGLCRSEKEGRVPLSDGGLVPPLPPFGQHVVTLLCPVVASAVTVTLEQLRYGLGRDSAELPEEVVAGVPQLHLARLWLRGELLEADEGDEAAAEPGDDLECSNISISSTSGSLSGSSSTAGSATDGRSGTADTAGGGASGSLYGLAPALVRTVGARPLQDRWGVELQTTEALFRGLALHVLRAGHVALLRLVVHATAPQRRVDIGLLRVPLSVPGTTLYFRFDSPLMGSGATIEFLDSYAGSRSTCTQGGATLCLYS